MRGTATEFSRRRTKAEVSKDAPTATARVSSSSDSGIVVHGGQVELEFDEDQDEVCFIRHVPVEGRLLALTGTLTLMLGAAVASAT
jgi:hypothetical protein